MKMTDDAKLNPINLTNDIVPRVMPYLYNSAKTYGNSLTELLLSGLADVEADQWAKHRKIMNHAFHVEKLKVHLLYGLPEQKCQYGPVAIRMAKRVISHGSEMETRSDLELEDECYEEILVTGDRLEGLNAFSEKRKPLYKGG
uniref:Uncharacterized protein n=1 Tax=Lactuca sativa TaxID=4236 RepID=A0A9R1WTZ8_LACSA|nr:hypothetical protein LSAT_V11C900462980 [Lactuca sativa]